MKEKKVGAAQQWLHGFVNATAGSGHCRSVQHIIARQRLSSTDPQQHTCTQTNSPPVVGQLVHEDEHHGVQEGSHDDAQGDGGGPAAGREHRQRDLDAHLHGQEGKEHRAEGACTQWAQSRCGSRGC